MFEVGLAVVGGLSYFNPCSLITEPRRKSLNRRRRQQAQTSRTDGELLNDNEPNRCTMLFPTASTAPFGDLNEIFSLRDLMENNFIAVPVQIPFIPR